MFLHVAGEWTQKPPVFTVVAVKCSNLLHQEAGALAFICLPPVTFTGFKRTGREFCGGFHWLIIAETATNGAKLPPCGANRRWRGAKVACLGSSFSLNQVRNFAENQRS